MLGREIGVIVSEFKNAGNHYAKFEPGKISSGIYCYVLNTEGMSISKQMVLVK